MLRKNAALALIVLVLGLRGLVMGQRRAEPVPSLCSSSPTLHQRRGVFWLEFGSRTSKGQRIDVPREWLISTKEQQQEEGAYVTSFSYAPSTTCFVVGNGELGLHVSSFAIQERGSAQAAAGRDVFLLVDAKGQELVAHLEFGITKGRFRAPACISASMSHFILADINQDGLTDIGVIREAIECPSEEDETQSPSKQGPRYKQFPIVWFVMSNRAWKIDENSGGLPAHYTELPLIDMAMSPVDFVGALMWHNYDSSQWPHAGNLTFVPEYRKTLSRYHNIP